MFLLFVGLTAMNQSSQSLKGSYEEGLTGLLQIGVNNLLKLCKGKKLSQTLWRRKNGNGKTFRITRRNGPDLYIRWSAYGAYPPRGMSMKVSLGEFIANYELAGE